MMLRECPKGERKSMFLEGMGGWERPQKRN
jgi:hypothetical protein